MTKMKKNHTYSYNSNENTIHTSLWGKALLTSAQLNKGTAFTKKEREAFGLLGKLPSRVETLEEQVQRAYKQLMSFKIDIKKNIFLNVLHDYNQVLFYRLAKDHLADILPLIYTPIVGAAVKGYSDEFRQARGLYISIEDQDQIEHILDHRTNPNIDVVVVTDGEAILGIGDQGIGGIDIPIAKSMVYTLCGGMHHLSTLPIMLDVGTNNQELLDNPLYLGLRKPRVDDDAYYAFLDRFIKAVSQKFPQAFLHWEDLSAVHAQTLLRKYNNKVCQFNDDIQGTGAITLAALLFAIQKNKSSLPEQKIVIYGAGNAGCGIANQILWAMEHCGLAKEKALRCFWLLDRDGLIHNQLDSVTESQSLFQRDFKEVQDWASGQIDLATTLEHVKPTILIGCSGRSGAFTQTMIEKLCHDVEYPIICPLSNPNECVEAKPSDLITWAQGNVHIATGSPFDPVSYKNDTFTIAQCNNALVFPGIGLAMSLSKSKQLSDKMLWAATKAVVDYHNKPSDTQSLLPGMHDGPKLAKYIAIAVIQEAIEAGLSQLDTNTDIEKLVNQHYWEPHYADYILNENL